MSSCALTEFESTAPTNTSDRVCSLITQCRVFEYEVAPATATSDTVCQCGAPDNTIILGSLQLSNLDASIVNANLTDVTSFASAVVDSLIAEAGSVFLSRISANFLVSIKGREDVVALADARSDNGDPSDLAEDVDLEVVFGLYSLLPCLSSVQSVSPLLSTVQGRRRRDVVFAEDSLLTYTISVPHHIAGDVACLLYDAGANSSGDVLDGVRTSHLRFVNDDTVLSKREVAFANGSCACGCLGGPVTPSVDTEEDTLPNWLVALLVLVLLALFVLLLLVYRRKQQQQDYIGPPTKLPAYIAAPLYTEDLEQDSEEPFVSRKTAPPYQPPPIWSPRLSEGDLGGPTIPNYEHPPEYFDIMDYEPVDPEDVLLSDDYPYSEDESLASSLGASNSLYSDTSDWYLTDPSEVDDYMQPPRSLEKYMDPPDIFDITSEPRQRPRNVPSYEQAPKFSELNDRYFME